MTSCVFIFTTPFQLNGAKRYIWWISTTGGIRTRTTAILSRLPPAFGLLWHMMRWCKESTASPCFLSLLLLYKTNRTDSFHFTGCTTDFSTDSGSWTHTVFLPWDFKSQFHYICILHTLLSTRIVSQKLCSPIDEIGKCSALRSR